mmetsp:Transcript_46401/g.121786  ORF Transcript_46401/g.121786 Transcript_46401/m.121786 type:complete len:115 (-) Transcript_46401:1500-1844(-)
MFSMPHQALRRLQEPPPCRRAEDARQPGVEVIVGCVRRHGAKCHLNSGGGRSPKRYSSTRDIPALQETRWKQPPLARVRPPLRQSEHHILAHGPPLPPAAHMLLFACAALFAER